MKLCPVCGSEYGEEAAFCSRDRSPLVPADARDSQGLVGQLVGERYQVERRLGEGGMGEVYLARHVLMGRPCALKVMSQALSKDPDAVSRFNREATNASRISHPNVCTVYDFGLTSEGLVYLAMEYVEGRTLSEVLEESGPMPVARAAALVAQCAAGLQAAHELGIVHRDLKPDNIMVLAGKGRERAKLVDFGIAKAVEGEPGQRVTRTGFVVGTPEYMSPEQLSGDAVDGRSDQYSLALVFYRLITGRLPFEGNSLQETLVKRLTDPPRPLASSRPDLVFPGGLQSIVDRALARDAQERYPSSVAFADAVHAVAAADQVPTRPIAAVAAPERTSIPPTRQTRAPVSQPRRLVVGVAGILVFGMVTWGAIKALRPATGEASRDTTQSRLPQPNPPAPAPSPAPSSAGLAAKTATPPAAPPDNRAAEADTSELDLDALESPRLRGQEMQKARLQLVMQRLSPQRRAQAAAFLGAAALQTGSQDSARDMFRRAWQLDPKPIYREQLRMLGDTIQS